MANRGDFGDQMQREIMRQAQSRLIAKTPLGAYYTDIQRLRSGTFFQPRYLVPFFFTAIVAIGGAAVSCLGIATAFILGR